MAQPIDLNTPYVSLATFRKSGKPVATPVWIAPAIDGDAATETGYVFSAGNAGKVQRLRNNTQIRVAACDVRGKLLSPAPSEQWPTGHAKLLSSSGEIQSALVALRAKYGWQMWLADVGAKLMGKYNKRAYIQVTLSNQELS